MKKHWLITAFAVAIMFVINSCNAQTSQTKTQITQSAKTDSVKVSYTCPMHPEVKSDKAGSCPKCGMDLVPKK